tara:strand:- start:5945 stop:6199 length:255 start_codon:yes stop_codon:yes gene_type:complete
MSASSLHMMEDAQQSQYQHQQELDQMQIRDEDITKALNIYIDEVQPSLVRSMGLGDDVAEALKTMMLRAAEVAVLDNKFNDINL